MFIIHASKANLNCHVLHTCMIKAMCIETNFHVCALIMLSCILASTAYINIHLEGGVAMKFAIQDATITANKLCFCTQNRFHY